MKPVIVATTLLVLICATFVPEATAPISMAMAQPAPAQAPAAQASPDMRGRWTGITHAIVRGNPPHHLPEGGQAAAPRMSEVPLTFTIEGQDGRRFWGSVASQRDREPLIGVIGLDLRSIYAQDSDGTYQGTIVGPDAIDLVYYHTGQTSVVSAYRITRQR